MERVAAAAPVAVAAVRTSTLGEGDLRAGEAERAEAQRPAAQWAAAVHVRGARREAQRLRGMPAVTHCPHEPQSKGVDDARAAAARAGDDGGAALGFGEAPAPDGPARRHILPGNGRQNHRVVRLCAIEHAA